MGWNRMKSTKAHIIFLIAGHINITGINRIRLYLTSQSKRSRGKGTCIAFPFEIRYKENMLGKWGSPGDHSEGVKDHSPGGPPGTPLDCSHDQALGFLSVKNLRLC